MFCAIALLFLITHVCGKENLHKLSTTTSPNVSETDYYTESTIGTSTDYACNELTDNCTINNVTIKELTTTPSSKDVTTKNKTKLNVNKKILRSSSRETCSCNLNVKQINLTIL